MGNEKIAVRNSLLLWPNSVHTIGKFLGLSIVRQLALHPDGIAVRAIGNGSVDGAVASTLQSVVTLTRSGSFPVEEDIATHDLTGNGTRFVVRLALGLGQVLLLGLLLVLDVGSGIDGRRHGVVESLEVGGSQPLVFDALQLAAKLSFALRLDHEIVQRLEVGVRRSENETVVSRVDGGGDKSGSFGIGSGHSDEIAPCFTKY